MRTTLTASASSGCSHNICFVLRDENALDFSRDFIIVKLGQRRITSNSIDPATTPRQELGMVSPELGHGAGQVGPVAATAAALSQPGAALGHKLKSFHLEKALVFLDDKLMVATPNAVERGNRRHRKMQKGVYRVRRRQWLKGRLALDLQRDQRAAGRQATSSCLHKARGRG